MTKLWQKQWELNKTIEAFETGDDLVLDQKLVWADVAGSIAHAMQLAKIGIISQKELKQVRSGLLSIKKLDDQKKFILKLGDEDMHSKIENYLTEQYGVVGKKIHTGRSRNDQIATVLRLFTKQEMLVVWQLTIELAEAFLAFAKAYQWVPMPGYTHMQKAMPSSVGMWASSFAESLLDDLIHLKAAHALVDQSPLGSAAAYGVPLPLDREYVAKLLGFSKVQTNSLYCQNSRGKTEAAVVAAFVSLQLTINKFASDVLLFTTSEFGYFTVSDELVTGSSIMPQKKNIDVAELLRSKLHVVTGDYTTLLGIAGNLPSGYNRDFQDMKKPLMDALSVTNQSLCTATLLIQNLKPNEKKLAAAMTSELFATHQALEQVKHGKAFRDAYKSIVWKTTPSPKQIQKILHQSTHIGGTGNLGLPEMQKQLAAEHTLCLNAVKQFSTALARLG